MMQVELDNTAVRQKARESFSGAGKTEVAFNKYWHTVGILRGDLLHTGSFIKPLSRYANDLAGKDKVDAGDEENALRDLYKLRYGETLNTTRQNMIDCESILRAAGDEQARTYAEHTIKLISEGETMRHFLAVDRAAVAMSRQHGVSELGAKKMMSEAYEQTYKRPFYEACKECEAQYHLPVREAQREARKAERRELARTGPER